MRAAYVAEIRQDDPLAGLVIGELEPKTPDDWVTIQVKATSLNQHDLWSLRGIGLARRRLPMILGCDAAGVDSDGNDVVVHGVIADAAAGGGDETMDPKRTVLSEKWPGTFAERVRIPARNVVPKPPELSFQAAACFPAVWLATYRMLRTRGRLPDGGAVLVQGAGGGVATAAVILASAIGARVYVTSRDPGKRERIAELGAIAIKPGTRLPELADVVIDSIGEPTFEHSLAYVKPGGRVVVSGALGGNLPSLDLRRIYYLQLEIVGSMAGTRDELVEVLSFCATHGIAPVIDSVYDFPSIPDAFRRFQSGDVFGKVVIDHTL
jgi:NADPH:quinone reductase-like Zn-dependent oxidoreductase